MSMLSQVTKGKIAQPFLGLCFGVDGVGKSTLGASMPSPLFIGPESGTANLDVSRLTVTSYRDVMALFKELLDKDTPYQTLVIDSLDWLEPLVWEHVILGAHDQKIKSIEDFGYGKGFQYAIDEWRRMIGVLNQLRERKKMNILLIGHAQVKLAKDPTVTAEYERYQLKLNDKAAALFREWVDCVFFANYETLTASDKKGKTRAFGDGARYLYTERRPAHDGKNRFGLPYQMPLDWDTLRDALESTNPEDPEVIIHNIRLLLEEPGVQSIKPAVEQSLEKAGRELDKLKRIENKLITIVNAQVA